MSSPSYSVKPFYAHPWRTARNHSILDTIFLILLGAVAFSLPLEGVVLSEGSRTFTFYFSILAAGVAVFRLPYLIRNVLRTPPLIVYMGSFLIGLVIYLLYPVRQPNSDVNLLIQLIMMSVMFIYVADQPQARRKILWAYWAGWAIFVVVSLVEVMNGAAQNTMQYSADVVRYQILNYSIGNHSGQVGAGLMLALPLAMSTRSTWKRLLLVASIGAGSLTLFFGGTRGALLGVVGTAGLWLVIDRFAAVRNVQVTRNSISKAVTLIVIIIMVFVVLTQTKIGVDMLDSMGERLNDTFKNGDLSSRDLIYEAAISVFDDYPMGVGIGNAQTYIGRRLDGADHDPHNHALRMFIETGVIGGLMFLVSLAFITRRGLKWYLRTQENFLFPMIFLFFYAATLAAFTYKITWFFVTMNSLTPLDSPEYRAEEAKAAEPSP